MRKRFPKSGLRILIGLVLTVAPLSVLAQVTAPDAEQIERLLRELKTPNVSAERIAAIRAVGFQLVADGRFDAAAPIFEGVLAAKPKDQQATYGAALSLFNLKRLIQARELAKLAVDYAGTDKTRKADALILLGVIQAVDGDNSTALANVRLAVQLAPENFDANFALGRALYGIGDLNNAVKAFRKAVSLNPKHPQALFFLATTLELAGDYMSAREAYLDLIRTNPGSAEGHLGFGVLLTKIEGGKSAQAIVELSKAVELKSDLYEARVALGKAFIRAGRFQEAIPHLDVAASLAPGNPEPHYQLGLAYRRLGNSAAAASAAARVNEINASRRGATKRSATSPVPDNKN
jgi:tetratricopeptide (TPR) repeat protein